MLPYVREFHSHQGPSPEDFMNEIVSIAHQEGATSSEGPVKTSFSAATPIDKAWFESWDKIMSNSGYKGDYVGGIVSLSF